ncbi:MAG TPA: Gfo/Idh/MocA family oxidoreductase, partial [Rhizomicrobium sp.]|nr:Gfo/Idh/MocA family oxidoreductase [Rhizomicrobium sp.]
LQVASVASRTLARAQTYAAKHGIARAVGDYRAVIDDPRIDAVYIPLPNNLHAQWSIAALEAGKAVLCEKPLSMNQSEAAAILAAVERTSGIFVEAFHYRFHPFIQRIKALLTEGAIGRVRNIEVRAQVPGALIPADNIRRKPELGGGAAMDLGIYCIDTLRYLMDATPQVLSAEATLSDPQIDGTMAASLRFADGTTASLRASHIYPEPMLDSVLIVEGEAGRLTATKHFLPQLGAELVLETAQGQSRETADTTSTYSYQAAAFVEFARGSGVLTTDARSGLENMKVIDALYRAAGLSPRGQ